jgi:hypothetical protein
MAGNKQNKLLIMHSEVGPFIPKEKGRTLQSKLQAQAKVSSTYRIHDRKGQTFDQFSVRCRQIQTYSHLKDQQVYQIYSKVATI